MAAVSNTGFGRGVSEDFYRKTPKLEPFLHNQYMELTALEKRG